MTANTARKQRVIVWLGAACLGLLAGPLSAQEPRRRDALKHPASEVRRLVTEVLKKVKAEPEKPALKAPQQNGFDSPQAATEALFAAMSKKDWKAGYCCFTPEGQELAVVHLISMTQFVVPIGTTREKDLQMFLKNHGFDVAKMLAEDEDAFKKEQEPRDNRKDIKRYANQIKNKEAFFAEALTWLDKNGSLSRQPEAPAQKQKPREATKKDQEEPEQLDLGTVDRGRLHASNLLRPYYGLKDLKIKGETASGKLNGQWTVEFRRVNDRWLVDLTDYDSVTGVFLFDYLDDIHGWSY